MSNTDSTDDTYLSPLGSKAKHELLEIIRTRNARDFTNTNLPNRTNEPDGLLSWSFVLEIYLYSVDSHDYFPLVSGSTTNLVVLKNKYRGL